MPISGWLEVNQEQFMKKVVSVLFTETYKLITSSIKLIYLSHLYLRDSPEITVIHDILINDS